MAQNQEIVKALAALVESSQIANKTNLAILSTIESMANQQPSVNDNSELVEQFTSAMETARQADLVPVGSGNSQQSSHKLVLSPKLDFAIRWLQANPQDIKKSGRELEKTIFMDSQKISYKWWNKAKKMI